MVKSVNTVGYRAPRSNAKPRVYGTTTKKQARHVRRKRIGQGIMKALPYVSKGLSYAAPFLPGPAQMAARGINSVLNTITGLGDYTVKYNSLMEGASTSLSGDYVPIVTNSNGNVRIRHREYIQDINSTTVFNNTNFGINPGLRGSFPWLSAVAQNFQQYKLHGCVFTFVSTSADALNSTNTALGTVMLGTNYNASQPVFTSKSQIENNEYTTSTKPSHSVLHMIECDPEQTSSRGLLYVRTGNLPAGQDIKTYDIGNFQICTVGSQAITNIGELHVSYDIELLKPQDLSILNYFEQVSHYYLPGILVAGNLHFGPAPFTRIDNIGITLTSNKITFPYNVNNGDVFLIMYSCTGVAAVLADPTLTFNACTRINYWLNGTNGGASDAGFNNTSYITSFAVQMNNPTTVNNPSITFTVGTLPTATCNGDLWIVQLPSNVS
nr:putative capsid protein [Crucivirus sp.]